MLPCVKGIIPHLTGTPTEEGDFAFTVQLFDGLTAVFVACVIEVLDAWGSTEGGDTTWTNVEDPSTTWTDEEEPVSVWA